MIILLIVLTVVMSTISIRIEKVRVSNYNEKNKIEYICLQIPVEITGKSRYNICYHIIFPKGTEQHETDKISFSDSEIAVE